MFLFNSVVSCGSVSLFVLLLRSTRLMLYFSSLRCYASRKKCSESARITCLTQIFIPMLWTGSFKPHLMEWKQAREAFELDLMSRAFKWKSHKHVYNNTSTETWRVQFWLIFYIVDKTCMFRISLGKERCKASNSPCENTNKGKDKAKRASSFNWTEHTCFNKLRYISG